MEWAAGTCGVLGTEEVEGRGGDACTPPLKASARGLARACVWAVGRGGRVAVWVDWFSLVVVGGGGDGCESLGPPTDSRGPRPSWPPNMPQLSGPPLGSGWSPW